MDRDDQQEAWQQELMTWREREAVEALERALAAGTKKEDIELLARECGVRWKPDAHT